ncbi:permease [Asticcacaulis sp. EMRT-3]|uniref:AmpG family muropeptide MFS transporter n=1 Tax=Asticcacaulis sp. EMRT-3 TaxID=3040349 RepID=UPI0024AEB1C7|nr:permease [Asticcacaulis sp. EMRT-3]MDI7774238.1 permease [Asticcacaulis sp. EMRT-3]
MAHSPDNSTPLRATTSHLADLRHSLRQPTSWLLIGLGFSSGLPFLLVGSTLNLWLRGEGIALTVIGFMSWVTLLYGLKIVWAPWMDKVRLPLLYAWLGQRRSYMLLSQIGVAIGLVAMALIGPRHLWPFVAAAVFVTFCAASQEIAIDAWRVEQTKTRTDQAFNPSAYSLGVKIGLWSASSIILIVGNHLGWPFTYELMAACIGIGMITTLLAHRTEAEIRDRDAPKTFRELVIEPFVSFYQQHKGTAGLILLTLAFYRLGDYLIGPVCTPMYQDTGLDLDAIGALRGTVGLAAGFAGIGIGGACLLFFGLRRAFWLGALVGPASNLFFSWLSLVHGNLVLFGTALVVDDIGDGIAETALVAFMTSLIVRGEEGRDHTLTHYALMYSVVALSGKFLKGFSGLLIDSFKPILGLFPAYALFFAFTAALAIPTLFLCWRLGQKGVFTAR